MKISLSVSELQEVIKKAQKCMPKATDYKKVPAIHSVKFSTLENGITMTTSTYNSTCIFSLSGRIEEQGEMLVSAETLKLISKLKNTYEITIDENLITSGSKTLKFNSTPASEFPITIDECTIVAFSIPQPELIKALSVNYTCAIDDNRPIFNGVCIDQNSFVATDTHRMAWHRAQIVNALEKQIIIPLHITKLLQNTLLDKKVGNFPVTVLVDTKGENCKFEFMGTIVLTKLIDGTFPNYKQIIPHDATTKVKLNVKNLLDELSFVEDIAKQSGGTITLGVDEKAIYFDAMAEGNAVTLTIESNITGQEIPCMGISYKFLIDALKNVEEEEIEIKFNGPYSPVSFNNSIVLPVRLPEMKRLNVA